jgi:hypothetical protein
VLVFATEFPAKRGTTTADFLQVAKEWLTGSPNNDWVGTDFSDEPPDSLTAYTKSGQSVVVGLLDNERAQYAGLRYQWIEQSKREWVTELVAKNQATFLWVSVRLYCTLLSPSSILPTPQKPYIIKKLFEYLGGGNDGGLMTSDRPHYLLDSSLGDAAQMIQGTLGNRLPVVYLSRNFRGETTVGEVTLSQRLSGMSHVVVEPSKAFSFRLTHEVGGNNAYGGAVGIYWPNGAGAHLRLLPRDYGAPRFLVEEIVKRVRAALCSMRASPDCTWAYLNELLSQRRIEILKASGSTAVNEYVDAFDAELGAKDIRLQEAEAEISRLKAEVRRFGLAHSGIDEGILKLGAEQDFYPGEIQDVALRVLRKGLNNVEQNSRTAHVLDDLLKVNRESQIRDDMMDEIKQLDSIRNLGSREIAALKAIGFTITADGKHYKAVYRDDGRYTFALSKTSSDHRASKNLTSEILRKLFR